MYRHVYICVYIHIYMYLYMYIYIFSKVISASTVGFNEFGYSVALLDNTLLVGAIHGSSNGVPEIQSVYCSADKGFFRLTFRGWSTGLLAVNTTRDELISALVSIPSVFSNLYSVTGMFCVYVYIHMHVCTYLYIYKYMCMYMHTCICLYLHDYIYAYICIYIYIYAYIYKYVHTPL
jgi:hypothetical protein